MHSRENKARFGTFILYGFIQSYDGVSPKADRKEGGYPITLLFANIAPPCVQSTNIQTLDSLTVDVTCSTLMNDAMEKAYNDSDYPIVIGVVH